VRGKEESKMKQNLRLSNGLEWLLSETEKRVYEKVQRQDEALIL
jgi:hypothetical protein